MEKKLIPEEEANCEPLLISGNGKKEGRVSKEQCLTDGPNYRIETKARTAKAIRMGKCTC